MLQSSSDDVSFRLGRQHGTSDATVSGLVTNVHAFCRLFFADGVLKRVSGCSPISLAGTLPSAQGAGCGMVKTEVAYQAHAFDAYPCVAVPQRPNAVLICVRPAPRPLTGLQWTSLDLPVQ